MTRSLPLLCLSVVVFTGPAHSEEPRTAFRTATVKRGAVTAGVTASGVLQPEEVVRAELDVGKADLVVAQAAVRAEEVHLDYATIRAPVSGIILDRRVNVGQTVVPSLNAPSLFLIARDLKRFQCWASVAESDIG